MRVVIIRHGKVDFQWKKWSTSKQFDEDCIMYDEAPLCAGITSSKKLPLIFWNVLGRLQWFFNIHSQKERRRDRLHYCYTWILYAYPLKPNEEKIISNQPYTIKLFKRRMCYCRTINSNL